jgi:peptidoglycan/LPS O-acetylase OafA/YrhL
MSNRLLKSGRTMEFPARREWLRRAGRLFPPVQAVVQFTWLRLKPLAAGLDGPFAVNPML